MTLLDQLLLAAQVSARKHAGHKRKDGTPYIAHPVRVMFRFEQIADFVEPDDEIVGKIAALLHDVVEDTDTTSEELRELGFSPVVIKTVDALTRHSGETYSDFIDRCKVHWIARVVKLADIEDNLADQSALDPEEATFLRNRYTRALEKLK